MFKAVVPSQTVKFSFTYFPRKTATTLAATKTVSEENALPFSKVPRIPALPIIGNSWIYLPIIGKYNFRKLHKANMQKYYDYGPIHIDAFSNQLKFLNIFDPDDYAKVYRNEGKFPDRLIVKCFKKYRDAKKDIYNNGGLLTTIGEEWWDVRAASQPHMMKPKAIHAYLGVMDEVTKVFIDRMVHLRRKDGEVPDFLQELFKWSLESVGLVAFDTRLGGLDVNPHEDAVKMINAVNNVLECILKLEFSSLNLWQKFPSYTYRKFEKNMDYLSGKAFQYLTEAKQRLSEAPEDHEVTFLEQMISTSKDPRDLTAMITDMVFAGIDTTSCTVGYTLYHLARNPDAQDNLYREITSKLKGGPLTLQILNDLPYMKACVKESMRINPVALGNARLLTEDTVLSGYAVPAGTRVFIQNYVTCQLEKYFPEPQKFKPERFLRNEATHHPFAFLPFGFGTRMCIGQRIAQQEIWTLLTRIIQRYRVEYHYEDIDMVLKGIAAPDKPLRFQFYDR